MNLRALSLLVGMACSLPLSAANELLQLKYRSAEELLPLLQTALAGEGRLAPYGNQILVNAEPEKISELRSLLDQLDTPPRRLLISVDSSDQAQASDQGYRVDSSLGNGHVEVISGQGEQQGRNQLRIISRSTSSRSGGLQQIQTSEGTPALIHSGQSVPLTRQQVGPYGHIQQDTQYREVGQGFYVTARVNGSQVLLDISSYNDRLSQQQPGHIDTRQLSSRVSGQLGQWIELGNISSQNSNSQSGLLQQRGTRRSSDSSLRLKVETLD